jgi:hypothetical protein
MRIRWVALVLTVGALGCGDGRSTTGMGGAGGAASGGGGSAGTSGSAGAGGTTGVGGRGGAGGGAAGTTGAAGRGGTGGAVCTDSTIPSCTATSSPTASNGWFASGSWKGYANVYAAGGGNYIIAPSSFDLTDNYLCTAGAVGASANPERQAGFVWNVNQAMTPANTPPMTVTPIGAGVLIDAPGTTTEMRVNLNDATTTWCAPLPRAGGGLIPWSSFRTECWPGGQGTPYAMQPFLNIQIAATAREAEPTCFCFCVVSISPAAM